MFNMVYHETFLSEQRALKWLKEHGVSQSPDIQKIVNDVVRNGSEEIYASSLYYHGLKGKEFLTEEEISLYFGRSLGKLQHPTNKRTELEASQKKLIGNFGENFTKFIIEEKFGVKVTNANLYKMNKKGYDLSFTLDNKPFCVNVTARERFEHRTNHSGNKPNQDSANFYLPRQKNAREESKKDGFDNLYFCFIFYYHESEIIRAFFLKYGDFIQSDDLGKIKQKFVVNHIIKNLNLIKKNPYNLIIMESKIPITNEIFEEMLLSPL